jgi:ribosomal protein S18 acetylase RimI-like enzyme
VTVEGSLEFRLAAAEDIPWLTDTFIASLRDAITEIRGYWDENKERDQFQEQLRLADTFVLSRRATCVGFYTAWSESDHLFLGTLCVAPDHQNRGIGTVAMRVVMRQADGRPLRLSVLKSNRAARRFYERLGCRWVSSTERHDHFVWARNEASRQSED